MWILAVSSSAVRARKLVMWGSPLCNTVDAPSSRPTIWSSARLISVASVAMGWPTASACSTAANQASSLSVILKPSNNVYAVYVLMTEKLLLHGMLFEFQELCRTRDLEGLLRHVRAVQVSRSFDEMVQAMRAMQAMA
jgi:hypothetical protein